MAEYVQDWMQRQLWTLIEAACLLSGIEPVDASTFNKDPKTGGVPARIYTDLKDSIELEQLEFKETRDGFIQGRRIVPADAIAWAIGRKYEIPQELAALATPDETAERRQDRFHEVVERLKSQKVRAFKREAAKELNCNVSWLSKILRDRNKRLQGKDPKARKDWLQA